MRTLGLSLMLIATSSVAYAQDAAPDAIAEPAAAPDTPAEQAAVPVPPPVAVPPVVVVDPGPLPVEFHGYASQGFAISDHNNYYLSNTNRGTARLTDTALNATAQVTEKLRIVMQVAAVLNDYLPAPQLRIDFGFADYHLSDMLGIRTGRFRIMQGLYSEVWDTDIARVPIFLPTSVYDPSGRQLFLSANGVELYGRLGNEFTGTLNYWLDAGILDNFTINGLTDEIKWVGNGRLIYDTPLEGLRFGGAYLTAGANTTQQLSPIQTQQLIGAGLEPPGFDGTIALRFSDLWQAKAFIEYAIENLTVTAEYQRIHGNLTPTTPGPIPLAHIRNEGFYGMATYRWTSWFTTGAYASFAYFDYKARSTQPAAHTFDYALTTRFDINAYLAFKMEVHRIEGTSQLISTLNPDNTVANGWLFAARMSAAF